MKRTPNNFEANTTSSNAHINSKRFRNDMVGEQPRTSLNSCADSFNHLTTANSSLMDQYSKCSKIIFDYFNQNVQSHDCFRRKIQLKEAIYHMFKQIFPYLGVYIVGSSANGFGTNQSDVDICLVISHEELNQKTEAIYLLKMIAKGLRKASFINKLNVISARVPIIKFHDSHNNIECDLNLNNHIGIRNTHLLRCYSEQDWRVRPLVLSIKRWAKFHNINDASHQTVSSYSLTLMTIYYLQSVCRPPVLPVLQKLFPDKFDVDTNVAELRLNEDLPTFTSQNTQSLGELFAGFLEYFAKFKFEYGVISVRTGSIIPKNCLPREMLESENEKFSQWKYILIEEPFNLSNTARSVFDHFVFRQIVKVFQTSAAKIAQTKSFESLFNEQFYQPSYSNYDFSRNGNRQDDYSTDEF